MKIHFELNGWKVIDYKNQDFAKYEIIGPDGHAHVDGSRQAF